MTALRSEAADTEVLRRRAQALASALTDTHDRAVAVDVALVGVGNETIGIPARGLVKIVNAPPVSPLPSLPPVLRGIAQVRSTLMSVVDLGRLLGIDGAEAPGYLAVLESPNGAIGLAVDRVIGFRSVFADELSRNMLGSLDAVRPLRGVTKDLVSILDLDRLFKDERLVVDIT